MLYFKKHIFLMIFFVSCSSAKANESEYPGRGDRTWYFDSTFLRLKNPGDIDLSRFNDDVSVLPGTYSADIYINGLAIGRSDIVFSTQNYKSDNPCVSPDIIRKMNLDFDKIPKAALNKLASERSCVLINDILPTTTVEFDSGTQRLDISIPQIYIHDVPRGYVSSELWDSGVPAAFLGYDINGYANYSRGQQTNSAFGVLNTGINIGTWYLRHNGNYAWEDMRGSNYQSSSTFVQRDIPAIQGRFLAGQTNTSGILFDTLPFRGVELTHINQMLPDAKRGYAPDIRGVARTSAKVVVRQNSRIIYEKAVSPGPFQISDLFPTGYGGNLDVTVLEADGSIQKFQVPYASVTQLIRPGIHHYDIIFGTLDDKNLSEKPLLYQATYQRGISNWLTGYGGIQGSQHYYAAQLGAAISSPIGAFSADVTQANTYLTSNSIGPQVGQSYQLSYSKYILETDSNLTIAAYRYSTPGYMDYWTAMRLRDAEKKYQNVNNIIRPKNKFAVTLNQGLPGLWGQTFFTGYTQDYWNQKNSDLQYQVGYSNNYNSFSYNLSAGRVWNGRGHKETNLMLGITLPLGGNGKKHTPQLTANVNHSSNGLVGEQINISGTSGEENQYSYGMTGVNYNKGQGSSVAFNGQYRSPYTTLSASYGNGKNYQNASIGSSGTIIAWQNGIVTTPYTGNTFAIVDAPDAVGAKVSGYSGIKINPWGYAAVPYLSAYEMNEVVIDPKGISYDVELETTSQRVAPFEGAIVSLKYPTQKGYPILFSTSHNKELEIPFGADVFDSEKNNVGSVGQMGQVYVRVSKEQDMLLIKWGKENRQQCRLNYNINPKNTNNKNIAGLIHIKGDCL